MGILSSTGLALVGIGNGSAFVAVEALLTCVAAGTSSTGIGIAGFTVFLICLFGGLDNCVKLIGVAGFQLISIREVQFQDTVAVAGGQSGFHILVGSGQRNGSRRTCDGGAVLNDLNHNGGRIRDINHQLTFHIAQSVGDGDIGAQEGSDFRRDVVEDASQCGNVVAGHRMDAGGVGVDRSGQLGHVLILGSAAVGEVVTDTDAVEVVAVHVVNLIDSRLDVIAGAVILAVAVRHVRCAAVGRQSVGNEDHDGGSTFTDITKQLLALVDTALIVGTALAALVVLGNAAQAVIGGGAVGEVQPDGAVGTEHCNGKAGIDFGRIGGCQVGNQKLHGRFQTGHVGGIVGVHTVGVVHDEDHIDLGLVGLAAYGAGQGQGQIILTGGVTVGIQDLSGSFVHGHFLSFLHLGSATTGTAGVAAFIFRSGNFHSKGAGGVTIAGISNGINAGRNTFGCGNGYVGTVTVAAGSSSQAGHTGRDAVGVPPGADQGISSGATLLDGQIRSIQNIRNTAHFLDGAGFGGRFLLNGTAPNRKLTVGRFRIRRMLALIEGKAKGRSFDLRRSTLRFRSLLRLECIQNSPQETAAALFQSIGLLRRSNGSKNKHQSHQHGSQLTGCCFPIHLLHKSPSLVPLSHAAHFASQQFIKQA